MLTKLHEFAGRIYAAHPITLGTTAIRPGMLLHTRWHWALPLDSAPEFVREEGMAWEVLDGAPADRFADELHDANILVGGMTERIGLDGLFPFPQFGLLFIARLAYERSARLTIGAVRARTFVRGFAGHELRTMLRELRTTDRERWEWVDDDFLVTECYYTGDLRFEFRDRGESSARAEFEAQGVEIAPGFEAEWTGEQTLELRGTAEVPFAVRGMKV